MIRINPIRMFILAVGLLGVVYGTSFFIAVLVSGFIGVLLKTTDDWVYLWIGAPLSIVLAVYWTVSRWTYVKEFVTDRRGW